MTNREKWFEKLRHEQGHYTTNEANRRLLAQVSFDAIVSPGAGGKSTIMNHVAKIDDRFKRVSGFVTREQRPNDEPELYRYIHSDDEYAQLADEIDQHIPIQYAVHPAKDSLYGTHIEDYHSTHNIKDVWYNAIADFEKLGFERFTIIGLVAEPATWEEWFRHRFPKTDPNALPRITEATQELSWLIENEQRVQWLENRQGEIDSVAKEFIAISEGGAGSYYGSKLAKGMLRAAIRLEQEYTH